MTTARTNANAGQDVASLSTRVSSLESSVNAGLPKLHAQHRVNSTVAGGDLTAGAWRTRTINVLVTNDISGASLANNQITLPAGTYEILGFVPAYYVNQFKAILTRVSDQLTLITGSSEYNANGNAQTTSTLRGRFVLTATSALEVRMYVNTTRAGNGGGVASGLGVDEIYTDVLITQLR
ncbi:hypothetical protein SAMN05660463_00902 [Pseudomonas sp. URIL14HWK12:I9]|nr:hypothetical protein F474_00502 [Pseudomonas sp. URIL14HWK12:I12]PVZ26977.1 hypothetical protein F470_00157 [Pseudomonas sp. URIL14HWK12:I10]PVZ37866.1 hypothetical protein F472_00502 [Pseudomonas sp. URIL14HWK12:I11]SNZ05353.1 hypothetical protein SAMN05660463_00902 [Pseudomonas sp. URIL14HWK12:I9]